MASTKISFPDAKTFQSMMESLAKIIDEISMRITPEGVKAVAMDPAQIALITFELPPDSFIEYEVEEETRLGINIQNLVKILKRGKKGNKLDIEIEGDRVTWTIFGATVKKYRLLNLDVPEPEIPEATLEFNVKAAMIVDPFKNVLKDAEAVGDTLEIEAPDNTTLILRGKGVATAEAKITSDTPVLIEYEVKEPSKSAYSIDYLKHVIALTKVADTIVIEFSSDMPLKLSFKLPAGGNVTYLLAPKA
ncbi:MAG: DNA polymerase sliding clamp [Pyrodictiaceae archaeon]